MGTTPPKIDPRNRQEFKAALAEQRRWFMLRLWLAGAGFVIAVLFGGLSLTIARDAQNNAADAAAQAKSTAAAVALQAATSTRAVVDAQAGFCVRGNRLRAALRADVLERIAIRRNEGTLDRARLDAYQRSLKAFRPINCEAVTP